MDGVLANIKCNMQIQDVTSYSAECLVKLRVVLIIYDYHIFRVIFSTIVRLENSWSVSCILHMQIVQNAYLQCENLSRLCKCKAIFIGIMYSTIPFNCLPVFQRKRNIFVLFSYHIIAPRSGVILDLLRIPKQRH